MLAESIEGRLSFVFRESEVDGVVQFAAAISLSDLY